MPVIQALEAQGWKTYSFDMTERFSVSRLQHWFRSTKAQESNSQTKMRNRTGAEGGRRLTHLQELRAQVFACNPAVMKTHLVRDSTVTAKRLAEADDAGGSNGAVNKISFSVAAASNGVTATGRRTSATSGRLDRGVPSRAVAGNILSGLGATSGSPASVQHDNATGSAGLAAGADDNDEMAWALGQTDGPPPAGTVSKGKGKARPPITMRNVDADQVPVGLNPTSQVGTMLSPTVLTAMWKAKSTRTRRCARARCLRLCCQ